MARRVVQAALCTLCLVPAASWAQAGGEETASVYFLGVDHSPAGEDGVRLAEILGCEREVAADEAVEQSVAETGPCDANDRWALTERFLEIASAAGVAGVALDVRLDRWKPTSDPFNFGIVSLRGARHDTKRWEQSSSITHVVIDLSWLQIGNDERTRMQQGTVPELRYTVSRYFAYEQKSAQPPSPAELAGYYEEAFAAAVRSLLASVRERAARTIDRSAADVRYVSVVPPVVLPTMQRNLAALYPGRNLEPLLSRMSLAGAAYLEDRLLKLFASDSAFDAVVLLPNSDAQRYLRAEWLGFARRIEQLSGFAANLEAVGRLTPQLIELVPVCSQRGQSEEFGLEVRSNLVELVLDDLGEEKGTQDSLVRLRLTLVADVKLPLTGSSSISLLAAAAPPLKYDHVQGFARPAFLSNAEYFADYALSGINADAFEALVPDVVRRLQQSLAGGTDFSHPKFRESCNEADK